MQGFDEFLHTYMHEKQYFCSENHKSAITNHQ